VQTGLNGPEQQRMQKHHARHAPKLALGRRLKVGAGVQGSSARWVQAGAQKACILRQNCGGAVKLDDGNLTAWQLLPHRSPVAQIRLKLSDVINCKTQISAGCWREMSFAVTII
jgi:hypothetical protein